MAQYKFRASVRTVCTDRYILDLGRKQRRHCHAVLIVAMYILN